MSAFFALGGYGAYVWPAYGATAVVLAVLVAMSVAGHNRAKALVRRLEGEEGDVP